MPDRSRLYTRKCPADLVLEIRVGCGLDVSGIEFRFVGGSKRDSHPLNIGLRIDRLRVSICHPRLTKQVDPLAIRCKNWSFRERKVKDASVCGEMVDEFDFLGPGGQLAARK